jgi:hypothetical protein
VTSVTQTTLEAKTTRIADTEGVRLRIYLNFFLYYDLLN